MASMSNTVIIGTNSKRYKSWLNRQYKGKHNGAYYYAKEIEDIFLKGIDLPLCINTVGALFYKAHETPDYSVIVCHDNVNTVKTYMPLFKKHILWICSKQSVADVLIDKGETAVYIPLSVDTEYVEKFRRKKKTKDTAYIGNAWGFKEKFLRSLPDDVDQIHDLRRDDLLKEMAKYKNVIAEGRCLIEAKVLGANVTLPTYDTVEVADRDVYDTRTLLPEWHKVLKQHAKKHPMVVLRVKRQFKDLQAKVERKPNQVIAVTPERAKELLKNEHNIVERWRC